MTNCTVAGNTSTSTGSGISIFGISTTMTNCTFANNTGTAGSGAIDGTAPPGGFFTMTNCSVCNNMNAGIVITGGTVTLTNTIIAGNIGDVGNNKVTVGTNNVIGVAGSSGLTNTNGNQVNLTAQQLSLGVLGNYGGPVPTVPLLPGSIAIKAGTSTGAPSTDARGIARTGGIDVGAFQSQPFTLTLESGDSQSTIVNTAFPEPLVVTITGTGGDPVMGGYVTFTAPSSGAGLSQTITEVPITAGSTTSASFAAVANGESGGPYTVVASAAGAAPSETFTLTNEPLPPLPLTKAAIKLNFAKTGADSISFSGTLPIPAGFKALGQVISLNVGGVPVAVMLNSKGSAPKGNDAFKLVFKSKKGVVAKQTGKFSATFKNGTFATTLASSGLTDATAKKVPVTVVFTLTFNGTIYQTSKAMTYTATKGKTGMAK
jgi:hypothetical protein